MPDGPPDPLASLEGKALNANRLVVSIGIKNKVGARYFQVFLKNSSGETSQQPVLIGLHNQGKFPAYNWIEVILVSSRVDFASGPEILTEAPRQQLFNYLAELIPPGGHLMVEYESAEQQDTARSLARGIPPVLTPLGYSLFQAGCGSAFKDWHFAEGGSEGPRKLQGFKALNQQHARLKRDELRREIAAFLKQPPAADSELESAARQRALIILGKL